MKLAIMSDSHDDWENLEKAIDLANRESCEGLLFAGDLISPPGIAVLGKFQGQVQCVWGNNEGEKMAMTRNMDASKNIKLNGDVFEGEIDGVKIFMNHYPRLAELAAKSGEFDLCVHGHSHEIREERVGKTILLNPGSIKRGENPQFVIFETKTGEVRRINV